MTREEIIVRYRQQGKYWPLLLAQGFVESRLNPDAVSAAGCQGIAQFAPATWADCIARGWVPEHSSPFDPVVAIPAQAKYLEWLQARFLKGDIKKALASYNWGLGNVQGVVRASTGNWEIRLPIETACYIRQVLVLAEWISENP